jgi:hypothetical protein
MFCHWDPYSFGHQLNCCEVRKVDDEDDNDDDDNGDDGDDDNNNNNNNNSVSSAEAKSWRPQILRRSRDSQSCDKMADNTEL